MTGHWGVEDPAAVEGSDVEKRRAFLHASGVLESRIKLFVCLPLRTLDRMRIEESIDNIGKTSPSPDAP
jgi:arsenate reductase